MYGGHDKHTGHLLACSLCWQTEDVLIYQNVDFYDCSGKMAALRFLNFLGKKSEKKQEYLNRCSVCMQCWVANV